MVGGKGDDHTGDEHDDRSPTEPWVSSRLAAMEKTTGAANGIIAATAVNVPNRVGCGTLARA